MITIEEAKQIILREIPRGPAIKIPLEKGNNRVLAEDIVSPTDSPFFDSSAMDGFAIHCEEGSFDPDQTSCFFKADGLLAAGDIPEKALTRGEAIRIMTGALLPQGATAIVPDEEVIHERDGRIRVSSQILKGSHIRFKGEEVKKGEIVLKKGIPLTTGTTGFLASLGISDVSVYAPPKIFLLPTGSELVSDLSQRTDGKVIESNTLCLKTALEEFRIVPKRSHPVPDITRLLHAVAEVALNENDLVVITGGVSVGTFDLVKAILKGLGVETLFWKVAQKPGKPLYFGRRGSTFVFGLPGNPASSLVCFYEYIRPAILKWLGFEKTLLPEGEARLLTNLSKREGRAHFVRGRAFIREKELNVRPVSDQESHKMKSFVEANCLMVIPQNATDLKGGDLVKIHWLPGYFTDCEREEGL